MSDTTHINPRLAWAFYALIVLLVLSRLIPHPPNFTPIGAMGVFVGAYSVNRWQWLLPLLVLLVSDYFIGFYDVTVMACVYLGVLAACVIGHYGLFKKIRLVNLIGCGLISACVFFLFSNFGVWLVGELYPRTFEGLLQCYLAAIPFFGNTLLAYAVFMSLAFGIYELSQQHLKLKTA